MRTPFNTVIDSVRVKKVSTSAYKIPTDAPEADGTLSWNDTTLVLVEIEAANDIGIGYTYAHQATAVYIHQKLEPLVTGSNALDIAGVHQLLTKNIRNDGDCGIAMMAVSAIDCALWDLKAKLLQLPLCKLLGQVHESMLLYGSGGFTSYNKQQLQSQLAQWKGEGFSYVKMKIGSDASHDVQRVEDARQAIGDDVHLMVDANGAYSTRQAIDFATRIKSMGITWFEEPVPSSDLDGLSFIRQHMQPSVNIAAGEYGYNLAYFKNMLQAKAVDVLQADATRCGGITGFLNAGHLAEAFNIPFSSHCAPALHLHAAVALPSFFIAEYFHDHTRIESLLFDGVSPPQNGYLIPDLNSPGLGLRFKRQDAEKFKLKTAKL